MVILKRMSVGSNLLGMLRMESHPRDASCGMLFTGSSRVHMHGFPSLVVSSLPLASHYVMSIPSCSLKRLREILSFLLSKLMIFF